MSYNKKAHLQTNIEAIKMAFVLDRERRKATDEERAVLQQYSGFGGIKCVLNPAQNELDKAYWTKSEMDMFPMVADLHRVIRENSKDEQEYKRYYGSLKNSVLTAFYTPPEIIKTLSDTLNESGVTPARFLDPSAGNGAFAENFKMSFPTMETVCFEKDLLTGKILSHLQPENKVHIRGFEEIENRPDNQFDIVSSNIPFGDVSVFDTAFSNSRDPTRRQASRNIHNYFFLKGIDTLREGGVLVFITSQGVMNSPANEPIRHRLMENAALISAVRLPNNLFTDHAGTEVGSDLIILQKNSNKPRLTPEELAFIKSRKLSSGENVNNLFQNFNRVVHTKGYVDTDPYGKPAMVFIHEGGVQGMAADLHKMLSADFDKRLNRELYWDNTIQTRHPIHAYQPTTQDWEEMGKTIEEAERQSRFENPQEEQYGYRRKSTRELDWEENSLGFDDLFSIEDFADIKSQENSRKETEPPVKTQAHSINTEPVMSLYDLFGFSEEERKQLNTKKKGKKKPQSAQ
jgi:hypothetical protein